MPKKYFFAKKPKSPNTQRLIADKTKVQQRLLGGEKAAKIAQDYNISLYTLSQALDEIKVIWRQREIRTVNTPRLKSGACSSRNRQSC